MKPEKFKELGDLVTPIIHFINENFDPHTCIVIDNERFDVYQGLCGSGIGYMRKHIEHK